MTKVKIREVVQADLGSIKNEIIENPEVFIQNLVGSLGRTIKDPFSAYKMDLSLKYLKQVYESVYLFVKHGDFELLRRKDSKK